MDDLLIKTFKAVSDYNRILILGILQKKPMYVCQLAKAINLAFSTTSQHLRILTDAGLVLDQRNGRWIKYCIAQDSFNPYKKKIFSLIRSYIESNDELNRKINEITKQNFTQVC